jgi:hypothetical protein
MAYDAQRGVTVLFGGIGQHDQDFLGDTWEWNGSVWTQRAVPGPTARKEHVMCYDAQRHVCVLFGGYEQSYDTYNGYDIRRFEDTWEWNGTAWTMRTTPVAPARAESPLAYDCSRGVAVSFGGSTGGWDTAEWNGASWTDALVFHSPNDRRNHGLVYDSDRGLTILFGGYGGPGDDELGDTWAWNGAVWTALPSASPPSPRSELAMAYDNWRHRTVLFGGGVGANETWELSPSGWLQRQVTGPCARWQHAMSYDSQRHVAVLFGGESYCVQGVVADTWEWDGTTWTERQVSGPGARRGHSMAYDSQHGVTVLFGGNAATQLLRDTWLWDGTAWTMVPFFGPAARSGAGLAYDSQHGVTVLFGGRASDGSMLSDTWELRPPCTGVSITTQPSAAVVCATSAAIFTVGAEGSSPYTYQWQLLAVPGTWTTLGNDPLLLPCGGFANATPPDAATTSIGLTPCAGAIHYQIRCIVSNACGSATSDEATLTINSADFNGDGDTGTDADIEAFFACLAGNCCAACGSADFNGDGDTGTDADIESFFRVLAGGAC